MQANQGAVIWTLAIVTVLMLGFGLYAVSSIKTTVENAKVTVNVPTAQEIASAIVIPTSTTNAVEDKQIWEGVYHAEIATLTSQARSACISEFAASNGQKDIKNLIEDAFGETQYVTLVSEYTDDRDVVVNNLGLDDEADKDITLLGAVKVKYKLDEGSVLPVNKKVKVTCNVQADRDGDLEATLNYSL